MTACLLPLNSIFKNQTYKRLILKYLEPIQLKPSHTCIWITFAIHSIYSTNYSKYARWVNTLLKKQVGNSHYRSKFPVDATKTFTGKCPAFYWNQLYNILIIIQCLKLFCKKPARILVSTHRTGKAFFFTFKILSNNHYLHCNFALTMILILFF